ncbi:hypothetical protein [Pseudomonas sp. ES3-33]|uniref:hypothetical protein n=1 Tax=Pseudomonas sp. ES3-33 TaxID=1628833 RepID=UPI0005D3DC4F|nr:hypothetical protein [Pseudomonas sp. ES3-33]KJH75334.1 hypothetical protein UB23_19300 [Pseudomonas sp. ES3-33]
MNESRQSQILAGQTALAGKVFDFVPIQTNWSSQNIHASMVGSKATGSALPAIRRALHELKDASLIREPVSGCFQRSIATPKPSREPLMKAVSAVPTLKKPEVGALDALASLSAEVMGLADDLHRRMKSLAGRIEEVALSVAAEQEVNAESLGKLKQLQSLLKGIAQ